MLNNGLVDDMDNAFGKFEAYNTATIVTTSKCNNIVQTSAVIILLLLLFSL